jgi:hypothetical protein
VPGERWSRRDLPLYGVPPGIIEGAAVEGWIDAGMRNGASEISRWARPPPASTALAEAFAMT